MIEIDLKLLLRLDININEYLTLLKIDGLSKDIDIPFNTDFNYLNLLEKKGYLESVGEAIKLTAKARQHFKINSIEDDITEIIDYFKETTGKSKTSSTSITNRRFVKDRLGQKYNKDDLKKVINIKYKEWKNDKTMSRYIRIETLFNQEKFQKYIGEVESLENVKEDGSFNNYKRI